MPHLPKITTLALGVALAGGTLAQAPPGGLEEVVVTAQKREESLQEVPIAVTALTGDTLSDLHITNVSEMYNTLPNVQINTFSNSPDSAVFTIRGVGVNDADPYVGTTVSVVVDGAVVGINTAALMSLFDIDRVEVLRGPQGTLFGANTTGGVINVVTKQPTGEFGGETQVVAGNHGRLDLNAAVNFPITDQLAGKVSILHTQHDGFFKNTLDGGDLGERDITVLRPYLQYTTDNYDATLIGEYARSRNGSQTNVNFSDASQAFHIPGYTDTGTIRHRRGQSPDQPDQNDRDTYGVTLSQNFSTGFGDLVAITNYREYDQELFSDDDATELVLLQTRRDTEHRQFTQELRTTLDLNDDTQLLVGAFYLDQQYDLAQAGKLDGFVRGLGQPQTQYQDMQSYSLFSQLYVDLNERWRLQAGVRASHEKLEARSTTANTFTTVPGGFASFDDPLIPGSLIVAEGDESWDEIGYKLSLDYQASDEVLLYSYYARGFKSGGFTGRIARPADIGPFAPEYLDTLEAGFKADLLNNTLRVNFAAFYNDYTDMQVTQNLTFPDGSNSASIRNAGAATTWGGELEITAVPTDRLQLNVSIAYLDASYDEYDTQALDDNGNLVDVSFAGNDLMNAPEWSTASSVQYALPVAGGNLDLFLQHTFTAEKYTNFTALPQEQTDSLNLFHGNITWTPGSENWSVGLYGRNLTDESYYAQMLYLPGTFAIAGLGNPREYGVDFKFNW